MKFYPILFAILYCFLPELVLANDFITKPDYVATADSTTVQEGGRVVLMWLGAIIGVTALCTTSYAGFLYATGKQESGREWFFGTMIGVGIAVFGGGIIFAVMEAMK